MNPFSFTKPTLDTDQYMSGLVSEQMSGNIPSGMDRAVAQSLQYDVQPSRLGQHYGEQPDYQSKNELNDLSEIGPGNYSNSESARRLALYNSLKPNIPDNGAMNHMQMGYSDVDHTQPAQLMSPRRAGRPLSPKNNWQPLPVNPFQFANPQGRPGGM